MRAPPSPIGNGRTFAEVPADQNPGPLFETVTVLLVVLVGLFVALWAKWGNRKKLPEEKANP